MAGNTGDTGDTGDTGNAGSAGIQGELGGGWFIEDRVDLPFIMELDPVNALLRLQRIGSARGFGERAWAARWWAFLALHDFVATAWRVTTDPVMAGAWGTVTGAVTSGELDNLANAARDERAPAMGEILSQDIEFITDFMALLMMTPGSRPNTYRVLHIASQIASYAVLYYKGLRNRARPSQLLPALLPPIPVPGHASWPSGHATQAWLMTLCIENLLTGPFAGAALTGATPGAVAGMGDLGAISSNLRTLALQIARNREIAGLHYPSDSAHGRLLADTIFPFLTGMVAGTWFQKAVAAAKLEWP